jgi:carbonic anhydrase
MNTLLGTAFGLAGGLAVAQVPPYHDRTKGKASVFVLSCIDPRFTNDLAWFLTHNQELHADYDLFTLAGASLGALQESWKETLYKHIELAIQLHGIEEVWCFDHVDCGMYKATFGLEEDNDVNIHLEQMDKLKESLSTEFPTLKFRGYIFDKNGRVKLVDCCCNGCKIAK